MTFLTSFFNVYGHYLKSNKTEMNYYDKDKYNLRSTYQSIISIFQNRMKMILGDDRLILMGGGGGWHFVEIKILALKMLKINNLASFGKKINILTLNFLE